MSEDTQKAVETLKIAWQTIAGLEATLRKRNERIAELKEIVEASLYHDYAASAEWAARARAALEDELAP